MKLIKLVLAAAVGFSLAACSDKDTDLQDSLKGNTVDTISNYDLGNSVIPFPNDFLFAPNAAVPAADGTLNIPVEDITDLSDPKVAINGLDGFSTVAPITTGFTGAIDASSISGTSVRVYAVTKAAGPGGPITAFGHPNDTRATLTFGVDYVATLSSLDSTGSSLVIVPLKPLAPKTSYAVVITNELKSASGRAVGISGSYSLTRSANEIYDTSVDPATATAAEIRAAIKVIALQPPATATDVEVAAAGASAKKLETIRLGIVNPSEGILVAADNTLNSADIILHWTFSTQSITDVLGQTLSDIRAGGVPVTSLFATPVTQSPNTGEAGFVGSNIYVGQIDVPYYLTAPADTSDTGGLALNSFWHGVAGSLLTYLAANVSPVSTTTETIPLMLSIPNTGGGSPCSKGAGWPVVIYQHGITTNRATMLAVVDSLANACFAVVAIDLPMHGITGLESNAAIAGLKGIGAAGPAGAKITERTFDLDLVKQDASGNTIATVGDSVIDSSGKHYINLANLQNTRDNVRQGVSDLFTLNYALVTMDYDGGGPDFDANNVYFLGHSLGAMVGTTFVAIDTNVKDAVFAFGGSSLAKILDGSAAFGPTIAAGLAANNVVKGTETYESFLGAAQTVVDSGDPVNHATAAVSNRGVLFFEIVGGNGSPSDLVVPNTVPDGNDTTGTIPAPLAGTEPMIALMGLTHVNTDQGPGAAKLKVVTKYTSGSHSSLLDPEVDLAVFTEIQKQMANFFGSGGVFLNVTDDTVLQAP